MDRIKELNDFVDIFKKHAKAAAMIKAEYLLLDQAILQAKEDYRESDFDSAADYDIFLSSCEETSRVLSDLGDSSYALVDDLDRLITELGYF